MRIIAGEARGRSIKAPRGTRTRPTSDRVREALFSMIESRLPLSNKPVLDLYAGSGALALEALSRGASSAVAVDIAARCAAAITDNVRHLGFAGRCSVLRMAVPAALQRLAGQQQFAVVFADPPYEQDPGPLLCELGSAELLQPGALVVLEHRKNRQLDERYGALSRLAQRRYGDTMVSLFAYDATAPAEAS